MLSKGNELPTNTYEAKQVVYPLGLEIQKIHAYPNDCILYHGEEYENWMHVRYVRHHRRSAEMILTMLRVKNVIGRKFLPKLCGMLL